MDERVAKTMDNLRRHGFDVRFCETVEAANQLIDSFVKPGAAVGFGGSMTIQEMKTADYLAPKAIEVIDHNLPGLSAAEKAELRQRELSSDVFLTSSNAVTEEGQLYNVDGAGNRIAAMTFGPGKVIIVCGVNKIVPDLSAARERVRQVAAPLNNLRLATGNPCIQAGHCVDCQAEGRICRVTAIMDRKPMMTDITIILVDQKLGY